jgi:anti-sigma B factor antagonist
MTTTEARAVSFQVTAITAGDCAVLRIAGDVDGYTAPELRQQLIDQGARHIVADLREVDFLDSTGLGALVGGLKRMRLRQGSLELVVSGGRVLQLFDVTGLNRAFTLHDSVLHAVCAGPHWQAALAGEDSGPADRRAEQWCRAHDLS